MLRAAAIAACLAGMLLARPETAAARVRLESICTVYGQHEVHLHGIGLVVGLNGTGDGGRNRPAMRALSSALKLMNTPAAIDELRDADNVAVVLIEATIPRTGIRAGQQIDCYVSSFMGAQDLRGGRLLAAPLETSQIEAGGRRNDVAVGLASGAIQIEDPVVPTTGVIKSGVSLLQGFESAFIDRRRGNIITLLLDPSHSSFHSSSEVARVVNEEFSFETGGRRIARAISPGEVQIQVPPEHQEAPVEFVAEVLSVGIDNPHTQARVIVNERTGTIVVTGEVQISPVVISHRNLTVQVGPVLPGDPGETGRFVPIQDSQAPQQLQELVKALNQLRVPTTDIIRIIRELHRSGKLHAAYEEQ
ncbi:MAG: flagellar basal body P-ring protein FlgI [Planctomycetaceae bacterium]|nr:flagellar basal body P-ring protein FlgI [Planctomycetaceae bacterium]